MLCRCILLAIAVAAWGGEGMYVANDADRCRTGVMCFMFRAGGIRKKEADRQSSSCALVLRRYRLVHEQGGDT